MKPHIVVFAVIVDVECCDSPKGAGDLGPFERVTVFNIYNDWEPSPAPVPSIFGDIKVEREYKAAGVSDNINKFLPDPCPSTSSIRSGRNSSGVAN